LRYGETLRTQAVVAALLVVILGLACEMLPMLPIEAIFASFVALLFGIFWWLGGEAPVISDEGVRFTHWLIFTKQVPFSVVTDTRVEPFFRSARLVLLGQGGVSLGALPADHSERVLRALGPRRTPLSLSDLKRPKGASITEWRVHLDERATVLGNVGYRVAPTADIETLASAVADESCALDVRAGAAYVLVQSGLEAATDRARIALQTAPPLAIAMARSARGGQEFVGKDAAREATRVLAETGELPPSSLAESETLRRNLPQRTCLSTRSLESPGDEEPEEHERDEHR